MITEMMVTKVLAGIGAYTIASKTIVPAAEWAGKIVGRGVGKLLSKRRKKGVIAERKGKVEVDDQANEQAILALLAECDKALSENETKEEPDNVVTVVEEVKPEPMFDQKMQDWIRQVQEQYGGFANVVLG
jgi:hypothetical protein